MYLKEEVISIHQKKGQEIIEEEHLQHFLCNKTSLLSLPILNTIKYIKDKERKEGGDREEEKKRGEK